MNCSDHMMNWGWGGGVMMIAWVLLIAAILFWLIIAVQKNYNQGQKMDSVMDILKKRYARGEITKEQYLEMKNDLLGKD